MERHPPRRTGSFPNRHTIPASPPPEVPPPTTASRFTSPFHRKPSPDAPRTKPGRSDDSTATPSRSLWPSTSHKSGTLADHLGNDRLIDLAEGQEKPLTRYTDEDNDKGRKSKENRPMRYFGKLAFPRSSSKLSHGGGAGASPSHHPAPARQSVDENALAFRRRADSPAERALKPGSYDQKSGDGAATSKVAVAGTESTMRRSNSHSFRSSTTQWALSPGRPVDSPPTSSHGLRRSLSGVRAESPVKNKGVGNFINSLGLDLFRRKGSGVAAAGGPSSPPAYAVTNTPRSIGGGVVIGETGHQFRLMHNRLIQWRFVNARSDSVNHIKSVNAEAMLLSSSAGISKLHAYVAQKQMELEKKKLDFKLITILFSQMEALKEWGNMEMQHSTSLSNTKDGLESVVTRVPLIEGVMVNPYELSIEIGEATDLGTMITDNISMFAPMAQNIVPLLFELAQVVTREKSFLEECFELISLATNMQLHEHSLKCHQIQLNSQEQQELSATNTKLMSTQLDLEMEYLR